MPQPYLKPIMEITVNRSPILRDDNFKPNPGDAGSNWTKDAGVTATSNGDILSLSGTTAANGITRSGLSISTDTYPKLTVRAKGSGTLDLLVTFSVGTQTLLINLTGSYATSTFTLTAAKTINSLKFQNQSVAGTNNIDYTMVCKDTPLQLHENDIVSASAIRATSSVDEFSLTVNNKSGINITKLAFPSVSTDRLHTVYIWMGYLGDDTLTRTLFRVFGGTLEEVTPSLSKSGDVLALNGPGWGAALLHTFVTKDYGIQSDNPTLDQLGEMVTDVFDSFVNASGTGYQITKSYLQAATETHNYIPFRNNTSLDTIKHLLDILTAKSASKEFWVDPSENAHFAPLGAWGSDPNPVNYPNALNVGRDQITNGFPKDVIHLRNQVKYIGGRLKPANRDYFTETVAATDWGFLIGGVGGTSGVSYDTTTFKVNTKSIKGNWSGQSTGSTTVILRYPSGFTLGLDVTKMGGKTSPPHLVCFGKSTNTRWSFAVDYESSSGNAFTTPLHPAGPVTEGFNTVDWQFFDIPFGPYGESTIVTGSPNWNSVQRLGFNFHFDAQKTSGDVFIDGLYLAGQIGIIQKDSTRITQYSLRETSLFDGTVREEDAHKDLALAELKRLRNPVLRGTIRVPGIPDVLPGQKVTVTAPSANLSAVALRVLEVRHDYSKAGFTTELDLTDDLTNYQSLEPIKLANLLLDQAAPNFRKKEEHDIAMGELDPTITFTTIDNPS